MFTLKSYKDQVYNIGSPSPSPPESPLKRLPRKLDQDFTFAPVKAIPVLEISKSKCLKSKIPIVPIRKSKRKVESFDITPLGSPVKKVKMMSKQEFDMAMEKERVGNQQNIDKIMASLATVTASLGSLSSQLLSFTEETKQTDAAVKDEISNLGSQMVSLQCSVDTTRIKFESKLVELEGTVTNLQQTVAQNNALTTDSIKEAVIPILEEQIIPKVKADIRKEILAPVESAWNAMKSQEVEVHEHNMIVFNLKTSGTNLVKAAGDFLKDQMKVPDEDLLRTSIKHAYTLGKGKDGKPPPLLIRFGHPSERNHILTFSKNIVDKKISVEKDIPKAYQKEHKVFKEIAYKLRNMPELEFQTQIIFDGPYMRLRYRKKSSEGDKFHYIIHSSWKPPMETAPPEKSSLKTPIGSKPTTAPGLDILEKANASIFMTLKGMSVKQTEDTLKTNLENYLKADHKDLVTNVRNTKKPDLIVLYCVSWEASNTIASSYKEKFMDHEVSFSLFAKVNPAAMES